MDMLPPVHCRHVGIGDSKLLEAGSHEGATFHEVTLMIMDNSASLNSIASVLLF